MGKQTIPPLNRQTTSLKAWVWENASKRSMALMWVSPQTRLGTPCGSVLFLGRRPVFVGPGFFFQDIPCQVMCLYPAGPNMGLFVPSFSFPVDVLEPGALEASPNPKHRAPKHQARGARLAGRPIPRVQEERADWASGRGIRRRWTTSALGRSRASCPGPFFFHPVWKDHTWLGLGMQRLSDPFCRHWVWLQTLSNSASFGKDTNMDQSQGFRGSGQTHSIEWVLFPIRLKHVSGLAIFLRAHSFYKWLSHLFHRPTCLFSLSCAEGPDSSHRRFEGPIILSFPLLLGQFFEPRISERVPSSKFQAQAYLCPGPPTKGILRNSERDEPGAFFGPSVSGPQKTPFSLTPMRRESPGPHLSHQQARSRVCALKDPSCAARFSF